MLIKFLTPCLGQALGQWTGHVIEHSDQNVFGTRLFPDVIDRIFD